MTPQEYKWYADGVLERDDQHSERLRKIWAMIHDTNVTKASDQIGNKPMRLQKIWPLSRDIKIGDISINDKETVLERIRSQKKASILSGTAQL